VVIKQIPIQEMQTVERQAALNEVDVLKLLRHPNIIAYHANFLSEQSLMIVMEYAPGNRKDSRGTGLLHALPLLSYENCVLLYVVGKMFECRVSLFFFFFFFFFLHHSLLLI
jgi:hypothetical protein